jgi:hypothetical protein
MKSSAREGAGWLDIVRVLGVGDTPVADIKFVVYLNSVA